MKSLDTRRAELEARKALLLARVDQISDDLEESEGEKDWAEQATWHETDEVLRGLGVSAQDEMRMIEAAERRMAEGEYGYCTVCGEKISEERLDLLPATPFCRNHAPKHKLPA